MSWLDVPLLLEERDAIAHTIAWKGGGEGRKDLSIFNQIMGSRAAQAPHWSCCWRSHELGPCQRDAG